MADDIDQAAEFTEQHIERSIAAARQPVPEAVIGSCEACCDEDVWVRPCGGMPRCTPCRAKWQTRR